jgi:hypothetical protein
MRTPIWGRRRPRSARNEASLTRPPRAGKRPTAYATLKGKMGKGKMEIASLKPVMNGHKV